MLAGAAAVLAGQPALAADQAPPPIENAKEQVQNLKEQTQQKTMQFGSNEAPPVKSSQQNSNSSGSSSSNKSGLPEGNTWRYSEFLDAVQSGKVERVRFSKDGGALQLTATDGRRASVTLPNDPDLVDFLSKNSVDISVSEGEQQGGFTQLAGNLLFPLIAFAGLFFLFRRGNSGDNQGGPGTPGGMGGMGGALLVSYKSLLAARCTVRGNLYRLCRWSGTCQQPGLVLSKCAPF